MGQIGLPFLLLLATVLIACQPVNVPRDETGGVQSPPDEHAKPDQPEEVVTSQPELDDDRLQGMIPMSGDLECIWSGRELPLGTQKELQRLFFRAKFVTQLFEFGDLFVDHEPEDKIVVDGQEYFRLRNVQHFGTYERYVEFVDKTYVGAVTDRFLRSERILRVHDKIYVLSVGFGDTTVDTGRYSFEVLEADDQHIVVQLSVGRIDAESESPYDHVSRLEFRLSDAGWRIAVQGFEL